MTAFEINAIAFVAWIVAVLAVTFIVFQLPGIAPVPVEEVR